MALLTNFWGNRSCGSDRVANSFWCIHIFSPLSTKELAVVVRCSGDSLKERKDIPTVIKRSLVFLLAVSTRFIISLMFWCKISIEMFCKWGYFRWGKLLKRLGILFCTYPSVCLYPTTVQPIIGESLISYISNLVSLFTSRRRWSLRDDCWQSVVQGQGHFWTLPQGALVPDKHIMLDFFICKCIFIFFNLRPLYCLT